ncbi:hypothetical protein [uncultured Brevundimonas sp.]|uniref:hypothetical protein n=1 Tax=uncultured Brevundimonas sp. TaxID=213418 RepID=UPI0030EC3B79
MRRDRLELSFRHADARQPPDQVAAEFGDGRIVERIARHVRRQDHFPAVSR